MSKPLTRMLGAAVALLIAGNAASALAQCSTCAAPAAVVQPVPVTVAYAPTVTYEPYNGWYPGRMFDRMRMRRWSRRAEPTYTTAYAPSYTAAYAPTSYSASYAPATYSAAYTPYTASYAYPASSSPYLTAYAPLQRQATYYQPAVLQPVIADTGCSACSSYGGGCDACSSCSSSCSSCDAGIAQASYAAPAGGCASCAASSGTPSYDYGGGGGNYGQQTPQPQLTEPPTPADSQYRTQRLPTEPDRPEAAAPPAGADPGPATDEDDPDASYYPRLLSPVNDRTASRPTVDVWNAVYRKPVSMQQTSLRSEAAPQPTRERTQAEIDADAWHGVSR